MPFELKEKKGINYFIIPSFEETGIVRHGFSTKPLNFAVKKLEKRNEAVLSFKIFCEILGIDPENLVLSDQIHGDEVYFATEEDRGKGIFKESDIKGKDALITDRKNVALVTFYADCVPLFFLDKERPAIGLAHSGWRGTVKRIGKKTVLKMMEHFRTKPENLLVGIGPCIGKCCFEVDEPVIKVFERENFNWSDFSYYKGKDRWMVDLVLANKIILFEAGVKEENIVESGYCTYCEENLLFSYRREKEKAGSLVAVLELR